MPQCTLSSCYTRREAPRLYDGRKCLQHYKAQVFFVKKHLQQISYVTVMSEWLSSPIILDGQRASQFLLNFLPLHRANFVQYLSTTKVTEK